MKTPRNGATSFALALLFVIGVTSMSAAKTFVYVSNAQDGNIDACIMDTSNGALTSTGKTEAAKLVMPMTVSPNKKYLYAVIRSQPVRVSPMRLILQPARLHKSIGAASGQHALMSPLIVAGVTCSPRPMVATNLQ